MGKHRWPRTSFRPVIALLVILAMGFGAMVWAAMNEPVVAGTPETPEPNQPNQPPRQGGQPAPMDLGPTSVIVTPGHAPRGTVAAPAPPGPVLTVTLPAGGGTRTPDPATAAEAAGAPAAGAPAAGAPAASAPAASAPATKPAPPGPTTSAATAPTKSPTGPVAGYFVVTDQWATGFTAGVQLTNQSAAGQHWQVTLVFPANVKNLTNTWIAGGPDTATMHRSGQTVVFRSINPLADRASIGLYFQFDKDGESVRPSGCTVNNHNCG